ncbi:MAG: tetratricopeptide repeat protein [Egibacteraceae bacterium]
MADTDEDLAYARELARLEQMRREVEELCEHGKAKPDLVRRFNEAEHTQHAGYAVVLAASDCVQAGSKHPIPAADLIGLARDYVGRLWPGEPISDDELRAGIDWAASCEQGQLPLLIPVGDDAYRGSPAIGDRAGLATPPVPPQTWDWLFAHLPPNCLLELGDTTNLFGNDEMTERAWTRAFETGDEQIQAAASLGLGVLYERRGDDEDAVAVLERADISLLAESAQAAAALTLGRLYERRKDVERAVSYYQQAIDLDSWRASPQAACSLGLLLGYLGDADGAEVAFVHAIEARLFPYRAEAAYTLAILLHTLGKLDRAQIYYERAIASDGIVNDVAPKAALDLGRLHEQQGATDQAITAYEQALTGCNAKLVARTIWCYARLAAPKEHVEPIVVYQRLLARLRDYKVTAVTCQLGLWLNDQGEHATAAVLLEQAMTAGRGHDATEAAFWRGWLAHGEDDVTARAAYQRVIDGHHPEYAAKATNNLGVLLADHGEEAEALVTLASVRDYYPRGTAAAKAAFNAGLIHERAGQTDEARAAFEQAIDLDNPLLLPDAVAHLARLLLRAGDKAAAEALLAQWRNAEDPDLGEDVAHAFEHLRSDPSSPHHLGLAVEPW